MSMRTAIIGVRKANLTTQLRARLRKSVSVLIELAERLKSRSYVSNWEI